MGGEVAVRAVLAEPGQREIDEARVPGRQRFVVRPEALHHAGPEALDEHVGVRGQAPQHLLGLGPLEVQRQAALVAVHPVAGPALALKRAGSGAAVVAEIGPAGGRFDDADDVGAHVGQHHRRQRRRWHPIAFDDRDPLERSSHGRPPCA